MFHYFRELLFTFVLLSLGCTTIIIIIHFSLKSWRMGKGWSSICCPGKWMNAAAARQFCLSWGGRYSPPHYSPTLYDSVQYTWSDTMKPYLRSEEKREESHITTFLHICHRHLIRLHACTSPHKLCALLLSGSVSGRVHAHVRLYLMNVRMFSHGCQFYCNPRASCCPPSFIWRQSLGRRTMIECVMYV